jgi:hypothetical protein
MPATRGATFIIEIPAMKASNTHLAVKSPRTPQRAPRTRSNQSSPDNNAQISGIDNNFEVIKLPRLLRPQTRSTPSTRLQPGLSYSRSVSRLGTKP